MSKYYFSVILLLSVFNLSAQKEDLPSDSSLWKDSIWQPDLEVLSAQLYNMRQQVLEYPLADTVYLSLSAPMIDLIEDLDSLYIEELFDLKESFQRNTLQFKGRMQTYSYLYTDLAFDILLYCPNTYALFINTALNVHPFRYNKERRLQATNIFNKLLELLNAKDAEKISLMEKMVADLKDKKVSTASRILLGTPTADEKYNHDIIDALILSKRLVYN